jgi:hypothetical protein
MKKVFNQIIAITLLLLAATSCKDVLDQKSVDSFTEESVFSDIGTAKAFLGNCYKMMGGDSPNVLGARQILLATCTDQLLYIHDPGSNTFVKGNLSSDELGNFGDEWAFGFLHWGALYKNIQNVNTFIANVDVVPAVTESDIALIERLKGEAYFIRAYDYTQLLRGYGGVVINDKPFLLGEDFLTITRSTIEQTKDFILADIDQSIALLPESMEQGRATRAAAAALKSRLLTFCASTLTNGGYEATNALVSFPSGSKTALLEAARDAAKKVMDGTYGNFTLVGSTDDPPAPLTDADVKKYADNFFAIFDQKGAWNAETIWAIQFPPTGPFEEQWCPNLWNGPNGYHNWGSCNPLEPAIRSFEMADGTPFQWDAYSPGDQELREATAAEIAADPNINPYNGREPRFYASILFDGAPWQQRPADAAAFDPYNIIQTGNFHNDDGSLKTGGLDTRISPIENWNGTKDGYYLKKFLDPGLEGQFFKNTNHWVEFRYSEILLDYAEACIELGGADLLNGINAINLVRNRVGLPDRVTSDQATAREYLRHERAVEFFAEDHRWYDIRRWMIAPDVLTNVYAMNIKRFDNGNMEWNWDPSQDVDDRSFDTRNYWLPISRDEMNKTPALQQNPNY